MDKFKKDILILRSQLIGAGFTEALVALEKCLAYHTKKRKGGDPESSHQISIALFAMTLPGIKDLELLISIILLHDVREDYNVGHEEVVGWFYNREFGHKVAVSVEHMTKEFRGVRKDDKIVFEILATDEYGSLAKLCDRIHNLQTMVGVFTLEKQAAYVEEVIELFLPMLKKAKRNFPHHTQAYENIKHMLRSQMELIEHIHKAMEAKLV